MEQEAEDSARITHMIDGIRVEQANNPCEMCVCITLYSLLNGACLAFGGSIYVLVLLMNSSELHDMYYDPITHIKHWEIPNFIGLVGKNYRTSK